jgi:hypothetical protein
MTKSELREMIRECIQEELANSDKALTEARAVPDEKLLAYHLMTHPDFQSVCETGDIHAIIDFVDETIAASGLNTKGSQDLRTKILSKARGGDYVSGVAVMQLITNSYLGGKDMYSNPNKRRAFAY